MKKIISILVSTFIIGGAALAAGSSLVNDESAKKKAFENAGVTEERKQLGTNTTIPSPKPEITKNTKTEDIGKDGAKAVALRHAGVTEAEVVWKEVERDREDGRLEYQVEFRIGNKEYDYEVDATTGKILEFDVEVND